MTTLENADLMTAIITPFDENDAINYDALEKLTNHLIETGSRGFVIGGTTGETPTLTHDEKIELYTRFGQIAHFEAVAAQTVKPIIMYNIPGRTGVTMANETVVELAQNPMIAGVKQCTSIEDIEYLVDHTPDTFSVYSGEDAQALAAKAVGGQGVISVASHIYGSQIRAMYDALETGNVHEAGRLQRLLTPKMQALFMYPSPSPVKAVLNAQGFEVGDCRLPILSLNKEEKVNLAGRLGLESDALVHAVPVELGV